MDVPRGCQGPVGSISLKGCARVNIDLNAEFRLETCCLKSEVEAAGAGEERQNGGARSLARHEWPELVALYGADRENILGSLVQRSTQESSHCEPLHVFAQLIIRG